jgi:hypothetical protein
LEQQLHIARWALHHCRRFSVAVPGVLLHLPEPSAIIVVNDKQHHQQIEALLIYLASYGVQFTAEGEDLGL